MKPITRKHLQKITPNHHKAHLTGFNNQAVSQPQIDRNTALKMATSSLNHLLQLIGRDSSEPRDQSIRIPPLSLSPNISRSQRNREIQKWVASITKKVLSEAFKKFTAQELSEKQTKIFCSEQILANVLLSTKAESQLGMINCIRFNELDFQVIDSALKRSLEYLALKYPIADITQINKKLQKQIGKANSLDSNSNNYLLKSQIPFSYQNSGEYNSSIMKLLNYVRELIDHKDQNEQSAYQRFQDLFEGIFTKVETKLWVDNNKFSMQNPEKLKKQISNVNKKLDQFQEKCQSDEKLNRQAEEYRQKVKSYTYFAINRKISQNVGLFSNAEIQSENISIKNPAILRILTKWCQELQKKYQDQYYFLKKDQDMPQQQGQFTFFSIVGKKNVTKMVAEQKQELDKFKQQLTKNLYLNQSRNNYQDLKDQFHHIDEEEQIVGKFACKNVRRLENYLIQYLNKLIHGLNRVSQKYYDQNLKIRQNWKSPPQLLSFLIGDLIRCKFSSGQKEVLRVYRQLQILSQLYPQKLKIVRIKNRLNKGTKDILINIKFQEKILCEVQLAIKTKTDAFLEYSNKFSHYIYELTRSMFGPISEMCSIWSTDLRRQQFDRMLEIINHNLIEKTEKKIKNHQCQKSDLMAQKLPFLCSQCTRDIYKNDCVFESKKCKKCQDYFICGLCRLKYMDQKNLKTQIFKNRPQLKCSTINLLKDKQIPEYGIYIPKMSKTIQIQYFKSVNFDETVYIIVLQNNQIKLQTKILKKTLEKDKFFTENIIFKTGQIKQLISINQSRLRKQFITQDYLKNSYLNGKQGLSLDEMKLQNQDILKVENKNAEKKITSALFRGNLLTEFAPFAKKFPNLRFLTLNHNKIINLEGVGGLKKLKQLRLINNKIKVIPDQIENCSNLQILSLQKNQLQIISQKFGLLQNLKELKLNNNKLISIPQSLFSMQSLKILNLPQNKIESLPQQIKGLQNMEVLRIEKNNISSLPDEIGKLTKLKTLYLQKNKLQSVPDSFGLLVSLQQLTLSSNRLKQLPNTICKLTSLKVLNLFNNKVKIIPDNIGSLTNLQYFSIQTNLITQLPLQFFNLTKLTKLNLSNNRITKIPQGLGKLLNLKGLGMAKNQIQELPQSIGNLKNLNALNIVGNKLKQFPGSIFRISGLKWLHIQDNLIKQLPEDIWQLKSLKYFHIQNNMIETIPDGIRGLEHLIDLGVGNSKMKDLPPVIYEFPSIKKLQLSAMQIESLPQQLYKMVFLTHLDVHDNKILEIPDKISNLKNLQSILIYSNKISKITTKIKDLKCIVQLNLRKNQLQSLPEQFYSLKTLKILNLASNKLKIITKDFAKLKNISPQSLLLTGNPIEQIQCIDFILKKCTKKSIESYKNLLEKNQSEDDRQEQDDQAKQNEEEMEMDMNTDN